MSDFDSKLQQALQARQAAGLMRSRKVLASAQGTEVAVDGKTLLAFCSNDYLGLANHPEVLRAFMQAAERYGVGSGASHLISGHSLPHQRLEEELAEFTGRARVLTFSSGFMANLGVISTLAGKTDCVFEDRLNHASLLDGGLFSGARFRRYPHGDTVRLRAMLAADAARQGTTFIVSDGVFSMDGDKAPLPALIETATASGAQLMIDDAHGFGCLGRTGGGLLQVWQEQGVATGQQQVPILVGTFGKAFGTSGAFVAGSEALIETLIQFCRPYIYTTALPPAIAAATRCSLQLLQEESWRREHLQDLISRFRERCLALGFELSDSQTAIQALLLRDTRRCLQAAALLEQQGIMVLPIRPPTVPPGTDRLRITFSAAHTQTQLERLLQALEVVAAGLEPDDL